MPATRTFLLEVGCEEMPAGAVPAALEDLRRMLVEVIGTQLGPIEEPAGPPPFGGPRRLVCHLTGLLERGLDRFLTDPAGPPVSVAFDGEGRPTPAAIGFAKKMGVRVEELQRGMRGNEERVFVKRLLPGRLATDVLAEACPRVLGAMRFPKMMRWGNKGYCFVRPIHWILALLDDQVVEFEFMGVRSGRLTYGHRFLAPGPHEVPSAADYERILSERGGVVVRVKERLARIARARGAAAASMGWTVDEDDALMQELVFLNEHPGVIAGAFPETLLELPEPVLVTAMKHHQKYFPARRRDGALAPGFLAVINMASDPDGGIRRGNEWVLKARLADARFFWVEDRRKPLAQRVPDLARVTFHEKLGSNLSRVERIEELSASLAQACGLDAAATGHLRLAARLCKADLTTGMVGEFPELQGVMGGIYARAEGLPEPAARAIEEHYRPQSMTGVCPATPEGSLLALADKIDLLAGCFAVGLTPKGSTDPYGLRRAAHGVCRILMSDVMGSLEGRPRLRALLDAAVRRYAAQGVAAEAKAVDGAADFLAQRLRFLMEEAGMRIDTARATLAAGADDVRDAWARARSLTELRGRQHEADFESLAISAKRIRNILAQAREKGIEADGASVQTSRLVDAEEKELHAAVTRAAGRIEEEIASGDYEAALRRIASLRPQVDRFFDKVLVMTPDEPLRRNRLALLAGLLRLLSRVADFSEIVVEGEPAVRNA